MNREPRPQIRNKFGTWTLENIAALLNSRALSAREVRDELRVLFADYRRSGPNLQKMMAADSELEDKLRDLWEVRYVFTLSGFANLDLSPRPVPLDVSNDPRHKAILIFSKLIINRDWARLDGPCSWCDRYFVRQRNSFRAKQNVYCSRECSGAATATVSMKAKHETENTDKVEKAQDAVHRWKPGKIPVKEFVRQETNFTKTWITQAVNKGNLKLPT